MNLVNREMAILNKLSGLCSTKRAYRTRLLAKCQIILGNNIEETENYLTITLQNYKINRISNNLIKILMPYYQMKNLKMMLLQAKRLM